MPIPEDQLITWSNQGATVSSQETYASIKNALDRYTWPEDLTRDVYLQGSYRNSTNIRGNSDVDVVIEANSFFYSNLDASQKASLGFTAGRYTWAEFRALVISALKSYYGDALVDTSGTKSVKVLSAGNRLKADVVVAASYRRYSGLQLAAEGITFFAQNGEQIINYPKLHYSNGAAKNGDDQTKGWYKSTIRTFKNARERLVQNNPVLGGRYPSYFVECLLFNVVNHRFGGTHQMNFIDVLNWLNEELASERGAKFVCQNQQQWLFGDSIVQWKIADAKDLVVRLLALWNNW